MYLTLYLDAQGEHPDSSRPPPLSWLTVEGWAGLTGPPHPGLTGPPDPGLTGPPDPGLTGPPDPGLMKNGQYAFQNNLPEPQVEHLVNPKGQGILYYTIYIHYRVYYTILYTIGYTTPTT